jgi:hypothetical protein
MPTFHLEQLDAKLMAAFETAPHSAAGTLLGNIARDTMTGKGIPAGAAFPTANELLALQGICDLMDQAVQKQDIDVLINNLSPTNPGITYLKTALTKSGFFKILNKPGTVAIPTLQDLVRSRPHLVVKAPANAPTNNVLESRGSVVYEQLPDPNGTLRIVERDTASGQSRTVVDGLTQDQCGALLAMADQRPSNVVVYEVWQQQAAAAANPGGGGGGGTPAQGPAIQDNVPDVGDYQSLDPLLQDLMRAQQERINNGGT